MIYSLLLNILLTIFIGMYFNKYANKYGLIDNPNSRSSHNAPTVRGFGVVLFISIYITLFAFNYSLVIDNILLLVSIFIVMMLGLLDDAKGSSPIAKITSLFIVYIMLYLDGYVINNLGVFLNISFELYDVVAIAFTLFAIVAFTNAFNLIDGLDGLSGLIAIVIFSSFLLIGYLNNDQLLTTVSILFMSSIAVFLFFNWHPAKVFLGDSGSLMIGFVISVLGIKSLNYIEPIAIFYIAAIPIFDSLIVFSRRVSLRLSPFSPDQSHFHHILLYCLKGNIVKTVVTMVIMQLIFSIIGVVIIANVQDSFIPLIVFIFLLVVMYKLLTWRYLVQNSI